MNIKMERIVNVWFEPDRIYIRTDADNIYSRILDVFPILKAASKAQREEYNIELDGTALRWPSIDEDIHISSFINTETDLNNQAANPVATIFSRFPWLDVSAVAKETGISQSLFVQYLYGYKKPDDERLEQIRSTLRSMGQSMLNV